MADTAVNLPKVAFTLPWATQLRNREFVAVVREALLDPAFRGMVGEALDRELMAQTWQRSGNGRPAWSRSWELCRPQQWGERHVR